jgi:ATP-dependent RNA helicase DeaD
MMAGVHKLDALTRILEMEDFDAVIIFVRTRLATTELAEKLAARGYSAAPLNGDVPQQQREKTVERLKNGQLDILVATDVAARGLDVERISHVINYDIPYDVEAYVHRIGRTGRAGRTGIAILFAANRERRLLRAIEKATGNTIEPMDLPSAQQVSDRRSDRFKRDITATLDTRELDNARRIVSEYQQEYGVPVLEIAAALVLLAQGEARGPGIIPAQPPAGTAPMRAERPPREPRDKPRRERPAAAPQRDTVPGQGMERYRIEVGHQHGVKPGNIVGAIANEADVESEYIGRIVIHDDHSTVDLPAGMPPEIFRHLRSVWVSGQRLNITRLDDKSARAEPAPRKAAGKFAAGDDTAARGKPRKKPRKPNMPRQ